ncbi:MAG: AbrB/MazE/SpoVT family DNA-binding domain-containing protein, partial [Anaerolineales bacterium]|nr:AbrB/MazE/SpoVT family DNA-binding domain-containing protein [Anaerolineales bacterium]
MDVNTATWAEVDEQGRLVLPVEMTAQYGLRPGSRVRLEPDGNALRLHRPVSHLTKVYVEVTSLCNI